MINNLSGEELIVYLKAKLEAAKAVKRGMNKKEDVEVDDEEEEVFVEAAKKKEEAKTMTLEDEQEIPEEQPKDDHKTDENKGPGKDSEETKPTNSLEIKTLIQPRLQKNPNKMLKKQTLLSILQKTIDPRVPLKIRTIKIKSFGYGKTKYSPLGKG